MEYIKENSVQDELSFMKSMLDIIHQIYKLNIIHRDIKPAIHWYHLVYWFLYLHIFPAVCCSSSGWQSEGRIL